MHLLGYLCKNAFAVRYHTAHVAWDTFFLPPLRKLCVKPLYLLVGCINKHSAGGLETLLAVCARMFYFMAFIHAHVEYSRG